MQFKIRGKNVKLSSNLLYASLKIIYMCITS